MLALELTEARAILEKFKPDVKKGADGKVPCAELTISCPCDNPGVLAFFSPDLREILFSAEAADLAGGPQLRDPDMVFPIQRAEEMGGATFQIHLGIGEPVTFEDSAIGNFLISPVSGGAVILAFRVKCQPTEKQAGQLYMLQEQPITISVSPSELATMPEAA